MALNIGVNWFHSAKIMLRAMDASKTLFSKAFSALFQDTHNWDGEAVIKDFDKTLKNCYHGNQNSLLWALICNIDWKYIQVLLNVRWIKEDCWIPKIYIPNGKG